MKLEKRSAGEEAQAVDSEAAASKGTPSSRRKKPVVMYIMILFIVAFLLMALSFFMHQRSNTEVLGQLQSSVNTMQAVQETQEKVIALQEELSAAKAQTEAIAKEKSKSDQALTDAQQTNEALLALYALQQDYLAENYDACRAVMQTMEDENLVEALPADSENGITPPQLRYQQLKEAVLNK